MNARAALAWWTVLAILLFIGAGTIAAIMTALPFALLGGLCRRVADLFSKIADDGLVLMKHVHEAGDRWLEREKAR